MHVEVTCLFYWCVYACNFVFFFEHKTAYEMRISDWSSDVCSSDLVLSRMEREQLQRPTYPIRLHRQDDGSLVVLLRSSRLQPAQKFAHLQSGPRSRQLRTIQQCRFEPGMLQLSKNRARQTIRQRTF